MERQLIIALNTLSNFNSLVLSRQQENYIYTATTGFKELKRYLKAQFSISITNNALCEFYSKNLRGVLSKEKHRNDLIIKIDQRKFLDSLFYFVHASEKQLLQIYGWSEKEFKNKMDKLKEQLYPNYKNNNIQNINDLRDNLSNIMIHYSEQSRIYMLNDGTGSGKTHNVIKTYIDQTKEFIYLSNNAKLHNLIYITPQKMQMKFSDNIYNAAYKKNIPLLQIKSNSDLFDLDMICWSIFDEKKNVNITNGDFFDLLFTNKRIKSQSSLLSEMNKHINNINSSFIRRKYSEQEQNEQEKESEEIKGAEKPNIEVIFNNYNNYLSMIKANNYYSNEDILDKGKEFKKNMQNLAKFLITHMEESEFKNMITRMDARSINDIVIKNAYDFFYYIILHCNPLEIAKYRPCIICLTADKFAYNIGYGDYVKKTTKNTDSKRIRYVYQSIDQIISGIEPYKGGEVSKNVVKNETEQNLFLKNDFFKKSGNIYTEKNVSFSIVIDEEHIFSTKEISEYNSIDILGDRRRSDENQYNIVDSLAVIYRLMHNYISGDKGQTDVVKKDKQKFITQFIDNIYSYTDFFSNKRDCKNKNLLHDPVYLLFAHFANNSMHLTVDANHAEYLNLICNNIYAYSPKTMLQIDSLKNIKLTLDSSGIFIEKNEDNENDIFSLYDLFQLVLVLLYSCKDMPKSIYNTLASRYPDSQNKSLQRLSNVCHTYKDYLESMFDSTYYLEKTAPVNDLLVYFLSKIMFSIDLQKQFDSKFLPTIELGKNKTHYVAADIKITLSKEMFEVALVRILQNKGNKVFLLSATRGYDNIYSGQYNIDFFLKYKDKFNLYEVITRTDNLMLEFSNKRKEKRNISINRFGDQLKSNTYESFIVNSINTIDSSNVKKVNSSLTKEELSVFNEIYNKLIEKSKYAYGTYKKIEMSQLIFFIALHTAKRENAMIMTLSNAHIKTLTKDLFEMDKCGRKNFNVYNLTNKGKSKDQIYEFVLPFGNNDKIKKTRIILFNAGLGRESDLNNYFDIEDNINIIFISSYQSAGTGLNFCINKNQDFEAISFANDPYYSSVKGSGGLNTTPNSIIKLKEMASKNKNMNLEDIDNYFNSNESYAHLLKEHNLEKLKTIEQAIGRIERRDFEGQNTAINFVDNELYSLFTSILTQYSYCNNIHNGQPVINNKSLLNRSMYNVAEYVINDFKLPIEKRKELEDITINKNNIVKNFFESEYRDFAKKFRSGDPDYIFFPQFNSLLRDITNLNNWTEQKNKILLTLKEKISNKTLFYKIVNLFNAAASDIYEISDKKDLIISYNITRTGYTDITRSNYIFNIDEELSFSAIENIKDIECLQNELNGKKNKQYLPSPYFLSIIRGNIGEKIIRTILDDKKIKYKKDGFFEDKYAEIYEFFDFIIELEEKIICIDVKNWKFLDQKKGDKLRNNIDSKTTKVKALFNKNVEFYYINVDPQNNGNGLQGMNIFINQYDSYFYNLFIRRPYYIEKIKQQNNRDIRYAQLETGNLDINQEFYNMFKGEVL